MSKYEITNPLNGVILGGIIDHDDLPRQARLIQGVRNRFDSGNDAAVFVITGNQNANANWFHHNPPSIAVDFISG
jgi:hypothetical protein